MNQLTKENALLKLVWRLPDFFCQVIARNVKFCTEFCFNGWKEQCDCRDRRVHNFLARTAVIVYFAACYCCTATFINGLGLSVLGCAFIHVMYDIFFLKLIHNALHAIFLFWRYPCTLNIKQLQAVCRPASSTFFTCHKSSGKKISLHPCLNN